ncbi:MAG: pyruvate dehydrogenase (acetyl-transferring) E1 component subunit alpha [Candidatus Marsarchaeota archaeon]|jgi:pyruvate dehydrogenase E1 component alpha subunit|nr:pyruvate dehydrogenase (acetyl-transferring) E1 component subunit alpha [Candidatus Marsarchaeota archaeon]MCL5418395.1 pyruvate dehydrogenase (acetyl-transferring) E1 component subunit alpha [Candidatus Marsarchaeota archaeon]
MIMEVFKGSINYMQILDENGNIDRSLMPSDIDDSKLIEMYKSMSFARALDAKVLSLQRQGRAATYAPLIGEEATQIGSAFAMRSNDFFVPNFRQHGVYLARGLPLDLFFIYWRGIEEGNAVPESVNGLTVAVPVGTQMPHAAGIAYAFKYKKQDRAVVAYVGDGGTSEGEFYEALNFSGTFALPLVAIIENNQWAISVPRSRQSAAETLAQKGFAAGFKNILQVDGNDVLAVYKATKDAIEKANEGPSLIECVTYRLSMHTTSDDPTKYRPDEEVEKWKAKDPLLRLNKYLVAKGLWNSKLEEEMAADQKAKIDAAVEKAEAFTPDPKSMFDNVYSYIPPILKEELDDAVANGFYQ